MSSRTDLNETTIMHNLRSWVRARSASSGLVILFVLAFLPRIIGLIGFTHLDEGLTLTSAVRVLAGEYIPNSHIYTSFYYYINAAVIVVLYAIGRGIGFWHGTDEFRAQYFLDPTPFVFAIRMLSACLGALCAPLAAAIASRLGLSRWSSIIVGIVMALWPASVRLSHVGKPDIPSSFAILFLVWAALRKIDKPKSRWADAMVGIVLALALSFKQTNVVVCMPVFLGLMAVLKWHEKQPWSELVHGFFISSTICVFLLMPANLGAILDLKNFLYFQRFSATTQFTPGTLYEIVEGLVLRLVGLYIGITAPALIAWLSGPFVRHDWKFIMLWVSSLIGPLGLAALTGKNIVYYRLPPFEVLGLITGCVAALSLCQRKGLPRLIGLLLTIAILAFSTTGTLEVVRQAAAVPVTSRVAKVLKAIVRPDRDKILSTSRAILGVPVSVAAQDDEWQWHEERAKKYGVTLPQRAKEKSSRQGDAGSAYFVRTFPFVFGGMEDSSPEAMTKLVVPFSWPFQDEEWELDFWADRGFNIFVIEDEEYYQHTRVRLYRSLYQQIKDRCELVALLPSTRHLFFESSVTIFRLREHRAQPPGSLGPAGADGGPANRASRKSIHTEKNPPDEIVQGETSSNSTGR
jgi:4-amino-4-deoxy-L-arabinose transferase-like glycosyltransferase